MILEQVIQRLDNSACLPEFLQILHLLAIQDQTRLIQNPQRGMAISVIQSILGGILEDIAPFEAAWSIMYAATLRLDHIQDGDPVDDPLPNNEILGAQYNIVFGYYVLATAILDLLPSERIPFHRLLRLRSYWSEAMLCAASGQYRDVTMKYSHTFELELEGYQQISQAKTGALFALAFGGTAMLLTDESHMIEVMAQIGEIYGTLLQYSDDLLDFKTQSHPAPTLPLVLHMARPTHLTSLNSHTPNAFFLHIYSVYREHIVQLLMDFPISVQQGMLDLFAKTFEIQPVSEPN